jgi:formylmethanofuran dehydrogenase subunit E
MSKIIKARVISGRYLGETVRISNVSVLDNGRKNAACILSDGKRANIPVTELEIIEEKSEGPQVRKAQTASMPFISGSSSSRTLTHTKNMSKPRMQNKAPLPPHKTTLAICESCGAEYNLEERRGRPGKITQCENCYEALAFSNTSPKTSDG